jgi:hypothetical protein
VKAAPPTLPETPCELPPKLERTASHLAMIAEPRHAADGLRPRLIPALSVQEVGVAVNTPTYDQLLNPLLQALHVLGGSGSVKEIYDKALSCRSFQTRC